MVHEFEISWFSLQILFLSNHLLYTILQKNILFKMMLYPAIKNKSLITIDAKGSSSILQYIISQNLGNNNSICLCENHDMITQLRRWFLL